MLDSCEYCEIFKNTYWEEICEQLLLSLGPNDGTLCRNSQYLAIYFVSLEVLISHGFFNPLSANPTKLSNTLEQFVGNLPTNCLSVFDHFVGLALKGLNYFVTFSGKVWGQRGKIYFYHSKFRDQIYSVTWQETSVNVNFQLLIFNLCFLWKYFSSFDDIRENMYVF